MNRLTRTILIGFTALTLCSCTFEYSKNRIDYWSQTLGITDNIKVSRESWVLHPSTRLYVVAVGDAEQQSDLQQTVGAELADALDYEFTTVVRGKPTQTLSEALHKAYAQRCEFLVVPSFLKSPQSAAKPNPTDIDNSESVVDESPATDRSDKPDQLRIHLIDVANTHSAEAAIITAQSGWFSANSSEQWRRKVLSSYAHSLARAANPTL